MVSSQSEVHALNYIGYLAIWLSPIWGALFIRSPDLLIYHYYCEKIRYHVFSARIHVSQ